MFRELVNRYATPFTTGLFVVSTVSGVALFFHVGMSAFHGMHEWLSMLLIVPFVLHVWKNWGPIVKYLEHGWMVWPLAVSFVAAAAMAAPALMPGSAAGGGNPQIAMMRAFSQARIADLTPVLKISPDEMTKRLAAAGLTGTTPDATLAAAAKAAGKNERDVVIAVVTGAAH